MDLFEKIRLKHVSYVWIKDMNNLLKGDPKLEVLEVVEGLLDASDLLGTHLKVSSFKSRVKTCIICKDYKNEQLASRGPPGQGSRCR